MRPLITKPGSSHKSDYLSTFKNSLDDATPDTGTYIIIDYPYNKKFAKRNKFPTGKDVVIPLLDFFQQDALLPLSSDYTKEDELQTGHYFYVDDLKSDNLKITDDLTLHAKLIVVEKHTESKKLMVYRLAINKEDVEKLLILQREKVSLHKEVILNEDLPRAINTWTNLKKHVIDPLNDKLTDIYKLAKEGLINSFGLYCAYCDSIITDGVLLDIEHKLPKENFPDEKVNWDNFVIACKICNSTHKRQQPSLFFGKERILHKDNDRLYLTDWEFRLKISLSSLGVRTAFRETVEQLNTDDITYDYEIYTGTLEISGPLDDGDKETLKNCYDSDKFKAQVDELVTNEDTTQSIEVFPVSQQMLQDFGNSGGRFSYDIHTDVLSIKGTFDDNDIRTLSGYLDQTHDEQAIQLLNKMNDTVNTILELNEKSDILLLETGQLTLVDNTGEKLDFSYNNIRDQARRWVLWPDDVKNSIYALHYEKIETPHDTATDGNYLSWTNMEDDKYVVYEQKDKQISKVAVDVSVFDDAAMEIPELDFSAKSIIQIAGLNDVKTQINDGRLLNRTRTWIIAERQVRLLLQEINNRTTTQLLHAFFQKPENQPTPPQFAGAHQTTTWNNNWDELKKTFDNRSTIMESLIWNNLIEIAQATGHYSVWVNVFLTMSPGDTGKELANAFADKVQERSQKDQHDPHAYRSTNTQFVKNFITAS